MMTETRKS